MKRSQRINKRKAEKDKNENKEEMLSIKSTKTDFIQRLSREFFNVDTIELAKNLLGKVLVRQNEDGTVIRGKIVETEAYLGYEDKASNTFKGRKTEANAPMYMQSGTIFVYMTYGMYHCFNIVSKGKGAGVLIRALEPLEGLEIMKSRRLSKLKSKKSLKDNELCSGPSKLCISYNLTKKNANALDISTWSGLWVEPSDPPENPKQIVSCPRIGIDSVGIEWASKPWRFYIFGNSSVSKRNKAYEKEFTDET